MGLFYSSTTSVIGLCIHSTRGCGRKKIDPYQRLWMNKKRPIPEVVDE
jgi:hypothetical protein